MSRYIYRCSRCRTRNAFRRRVTDYVVKRKCRDCGHRHFYPDREHTHRVPCRCDGYHHPHRPGSPCCTRHAQWPINRLLRAKATPDDVADARLSLALDGFPLGREHAPGAPCPF